MTEPADFGHFSELWPDGDINPVRWDTDGEFGYFYNSGTGVAAGYCVLPRGNILATLGTYRFDVDTSVEFTLARPAAPTPGAGFTAWAMLESPRGDDNLFDGPSGPYIRIFYDGTDPVEDPTLTVDWSPASGTNQISYTEFVFGAATRFRFRRVRRNFGSDVDDTAFFAEYFDADVADWQGLGGGDLPIDDADRWRFVVEPGPHADAMRVGPIIGSPAPAVPPPAGTPPACANILNLVYEYSQAIGLPVRVDTLHQVTVLDASVTETPDGWKRYAAGVYVPAGSDWTAGAQADDGHPIVTVNWRGAVIRVAYPASYTFTSEDVGQTVVLGVPARGQPFILHKLIGLPSTEA